MISWESKGIDLGRYADRKSGYVKVHCPQCDGGKHGKNDKSLSCNCETGAFKCHRCGFQGYATITTDEEREAWMRQQPWYRDYSKHKNEQKKEYSRPPKPRSNKIDPNIIAFFARRGISEQTLTTMRVTSGTDWMPAHKNYRCRDRQGNPVDGANCTTIHFNYYRDGELIATKLRSGDKMFRQAKAGCEQIAYNIDGIKNSDDLYIVEGEMDALSLAEIGYTNVISVPDGGSDKAMHWLVDYWETHFANKKTVYICVDNDTVGSELCRELQKHFDPADCVIVTDFGLDPTDGHPLKDANECLMAYGPDTLRLKLAAGSSQRPEGDADMQSIADEMDNIYTHGLPQGIRVGFSNLDELVRFEKGRLVIVTGTPGSGKSQFLDQLAVRLNIGHGWRFSMFSPEMMPMALHMSMLVSKYTGRAFNREELLPERYQRAKQRIVDAFHFIDPDSYDLDGILSVARYQVRKYGCDALVIDPWNDLTMNGDGITKTDDINTALLRILTFAQRQQIVVFVMAHPAKIGRNKDGSVPTPTLSDISGSIHFYNRADIGLVVVRHKEDDGREYTEIKVAKMRFPNLGKVGETYFKYGIGVGRFHTYDPVTDNTQWDNDDYLDESYRQTTLPLNTTQQPAANNEANVQAFLSQAARADKQNQPRTSLEPDNDLPFDNNNTDIPF